MRGGGVLEVGEGEFGGGASFGVEEEGAVGIEVDGDGGEGGEGEGAFADAEEAGDDDDALVGDAVPDEHFLEHGDHEEEAGGGHQDKEDEQVVQVGHWLLTDAG